MVYYQIPEEYKFEIHHCRPRFKNNVEEVLIYMASEITEIGSLPADEFNRRLNSAIKCFPGNASLVKKTIDNWRTEISTLFGLFYKDDDNYCHAMLRAKELAEHNDLVQFFKQFLFYFQYPGAHLKNHAILEQIRNGVHFKPAQYFLKMLYEAEKKTGEKCYITKAEACYCVMNDLRCTRDNEDVLITWDRIQKNRKNEVNYEPIGDVIRYAGDILDYMENANLLKSYNGKDFYLNTLENEYIVKFINSKEWFDEYDNMIEAQDGSYTMINSCRCDWFEYVNRASSDTDFSTDITMYIDGVSEDDASQKLGLFKAYLDRIKDYENLNTKDIGDIGESLVHGHECERVKIAGRADLVHLIKKIPTELGVGYDISSREEDATIRNIEVKTTISLKPIRFNKVHLTPNEWQAAKSYQERYYIYRLMISKKEMKLFIMCNPVKLFKDDLIDISPNDGMDIVFKETAGKYEDLLAWTE